MLNKTDKRAIFAIFLFESQISCLVAYAAQCLELFFKLKKKGISGK